MPIETSRTGINNQLYGERKRMDDIKSGAPMPQASSNQPVPQAGATVNTGNLQDLPDNIPLDGMETVDPDTYNKAVTMSAWMHLVHANPTPEIESLVKEIIEVNKSGDLSGIDQITNNRLGTQQASEATPTQEDGAASSEQPDNTNLSNTL
jgi:phosphatidylethanolamine-binding protein (PEBP) family uncharacterized protein